ncbi:ABC transporter permease [Bacteroidota bacterium]
MLRNFFKIAYRNLVKHKIYTFINIAGFAIGLASCIIILLFVKYELSYDTFHKNADDIYRVAVRGVVGGNEFNQAITSPPMAAALVEDYPEVIKATRIMPTPNMLIRNKEIIFIESNFFWADSLFFEVFSFPLILGDPTTVLDEDHTVVLTKSLAMKYFGRIDVVGEIMEFEDYTPYKVTGVCEDTPDNAHFKFDMLASLSSLGWDKNTHWLNHSFYTYALLQPNYNPDDLKAKFPSLIKKYVEPQLQPIIGMTMEKFYENGGVFEYYLQPLKDIHLKSNIDYEIGPNGNITYIYIFSTIAIFILLIASINFMNLSTARSTTRAREVGVRKVLGSNISQLIRQFLTESVILTAIAMLFAVIIVYAALPFFNDIAGKQFELNLFGSVWTIPLMVCTILVVGTLAGIYPAFYLSSFQPVKVLKTSLTSGGKKSYLRSGLVIFQFGISIFLFVVTFVIREQLDFIQDKNLGWDKDNLLVVKRAWAVENNEDAFISELKQNSNIIEVAATRNIPGRDFGTSVLRKGGAPRSEQHLINLISAKYNLDKTFNFEMKEGRFFSREFASDTNSVVVNESLVRDLGYENPVGAQLVYPGESEDEDYPLTIIGVVKDFHYESFHQKIKPLAIFLHNEWPYFIGIRISGINVRETIEYVEDIWQKFIPDKPFEYFFMDEDFARLYNNEVRTSKIFSAFSLLAILIACLGLFGLATFTTLQRRKEIGIRKTMGASIPGIITLLSMQFSKWVLFANVIAWPAAYFFILKWLSNFEYKVDITILSFLIAGLSAFGIAIITIVYQAIKAALANPVDSLRYE